jgi:hypothetical protein
LLIITKEVPFDVLHVIMENLIDPVDLATCSLVNKKWNKVANAELLHKILLKRLTNAEKLSEKTWKQTLINYYGTFHNCISYRIYSF